MGKAELSAQRLKPDVAQGLAGIRSIAGTQSAGQMSVVVPGWTNRDGRGSGRSQWGLEWRARSSMRRCSFGNVRYRPPAKVTGPSRCRSVRRAREHIAPPDGESAELAGGLGMNWGRSLAFGASTSWKRFRCKPGRETSATGCRPFTFHISGRQIKRRELQMHCRLPAHRTRRWVFHSCSGHVAVDGGR